MSYDSFTEHILYVYVYMHACARIKRLSTRARDTAADLKDLNDSQDPASRATCYVEPVILSHMHAPNPTHPTAGVSRQGHECVQEDKGSCRYVAALDSGDGQIYIYMHTYSRAGQPLYVLHYRDIYIPSGSRSSWRMEAAWRSLRPSWTASEETLRRSDVCMRAWRI